jgi:transcriptional regulator with XRE-family HTH domain
MLSQGDVMSKGQKMLGRKVPNPIDIEVGKRIRVYRQQAGLSQTQLGDALKLTFQQVQKYEKGVNRVAPSRLEVIARVCGVLVSAFLPSLDGQKGNSGPLPFAALQINGAQDLLAAFGKIKNSKARAALVALAHEMVGSI